MVSGVKHKIFVGERANNRTERGLCFSSVFVEFKGMIMGVLYKHLRN